MTESHFPLRYVDLELQQHAAALRCLAGDLLRDPHAADDVTQATLQQAVRHRDLGPGPLGGWLRVVLQNFARQWRRGERRRSAREAALPAPAPAASPADTLVHRETLQAVTTAVLQLAEPYQSTILQRYFEDLPPRVIAERTGTGLATVKSRLQRGLALLRARLTAQHGGRDWRPALAAALGLPFAAPATVVSGAAGTLVLQWGGAAALLAATGWLVHTQWSSPRPPHATRTAGSAPAVARTEMAAPPLERTPADATAATAPPAAAAWLDHPYTFELELRVVDEFGLPIGHADVPFAPDDVALHTLRTDLGGRAVATWRSRTPTGWVWLEDGEQTLRRVPVAHGRRTSWTIGHLTLRQRRGQRGVPLLKVPLLGRLFERHGDDGDRTLAGGLHPFAVFADDLVSGAVPDVAVDDFEPTTQLSDAATTIVDTTGTVTPSLQGVVLTAAGAAAAQTTIAVFGDDPFPVARTATDATGAYSLELPAGTYTVRAGGDANGTATTRVVVRDATTAAPLVLQATRLLRGRVRTADGAPADSVLVVWRAQDGSAWDACRTMAGTFALADLPPTAGVLELWSADAERRLPTAVFAAPPDGPALDLRLPPDRGSTLLLRPRRAEGCAGPVTVRLWHHELARGFEATLAEGVDALRLPGLPAGNCELRLAASGSGWCDGGRHWLDGNSELDLGEIALAAPGTLRFAAIPGDSALVTGGELCRLRPDLDVRTNLTALLQDQPLLLPAGDYTWLQRDAAGALSTRRFVVQSGATTVVDRR
ncbi:MAG: carboxypeptidase regulatory-like domain-containing protein [Planctomycetes bacterium]|nr:carboxypeptidase regulatory-like domain-containing protein [Planctomycetota bacterium]